MTSAASRRAAEWRRVEEREGAPELHRSFHRQADAPRAAALLLHGAGGSPADFHFLASDLARYGISSLCPLLPGHGRGEAAFESLRYARLAERALEAFDALAADGVPPAIVGQSVGAVLGIHVATRRAPSRFVALAPALRPFVWRRLGALAVGFVIRPRLAAMTLRWQMDVRRGIRSTASRLPGVGCPLLVLHSRDDTSVSAAGARQFLDGAGSPEKGIVWLDGQGHVLSTAPDRERVFAPVRAFLTGATGEDRNGT